MDYDTYYPSDWEDQLTEEARVNEGSHDAKMLGGDRIIWWTGFKWQWTILNNSEQAKNFFYYLQSRGLA